MQNRIVQQYYKMQHEPHTGQTTEKEETIPHKKILLYYKSDET
jgi:hypothetical protein